MTELKTTSIMLTVEQWERLRNEAHKSRRSQAEIIREALEMRWAQKEKEEKKMKTYWIDECIVSPEGKLLPRGLELHIGETARIVVPSDVPGDRESLYEEEIQLSQETFAATYENGTPVHIKDGETIGEEKDDY